MPSEEVMMLLVIVVAGQLVWSGPKLSPAEAAAILAQSPALSNRTHVSPPGDGPTVVVVGSSVTAGPFGEFAPFPPPLRLDGTLLTQRAWIMRSHIGGRPFLRGEPRSVEFTAGVVAGAGSRGSHSRR
jgi:hypothetical protein